MILILGGTTEGRLAVRVADEAGSPYYYSTRGSLQQIFCKHGTHVTGGMDLQQMIAFCRKHTIRLLIDAAHPFATELHRTVAATAETLGLPVVRVERTYPERSGDVVWCKDYADAVRCLQQNGVSRLLALTGVQTIGKLKGYWQENTCWFRILKREESLCIARTQGFDDRYLVYYEQEGEEEALLAELRPQAILTKESGESGGFREKVEAAQKWNIPVYAIQRPVLPETFISVTGEYGLRKQIEHHVPDFYPLRSGYTTGACATVAAKAALLALLGEEVPSSVSVRFPNGEELPLPVHEVRREGGSAQATVIKDAGDDPDVTHGASIVVTVSFSSQPGIHFLKGEGVGKITLPGLGLEVGSPAINPVPRAMMTDELSALYSGGLDVTVSVPSGRELAQRTFNPKLGIVDGISIVGTSGVVLPFSSEAFVGAIRKEAEVYRALGGRHLVTNSGAKSERFLKATYPELPSQAFVHFGNFIGETLRIAHELRFERLTLGIMIGKAVKLAEGYLDTHSKKVVMNKNYLKQLAENAGCSQEAQTIIDRLTLARELWTSLPETDARSFFERLLEECYLHCRPLFPDGELVILLVDEDGKIVGKP